MLLALVLLEHSFRIPGFVQGDGVFQKHLTWAHGCIGSQVELHQGEATSRSAAASDAQPASAPAAAAAPSAGALQPSADDVLRHRSNKPAHLSPEAKSAQPSNGTKLVRQLQDTADNDAALLHGTHEAQSPVSGVDSGEGAAEEDTEAQRRWNRMR